MSRLTLRRRAATLGQPYRTDRKGARLLRQGALMTAGCGIATVGQSVSNLLAGFPFFASLPAEDITPLVLLLHPARCERNRVVGHVDGENATLFVVVSGAVRQPRHPTIWDWLAVRRATP